MKFNVNHKVRVKLTDKGRAILKDQHYDHVRVLRESGRKVLSEYWAKAEDADGWSDWQLWDLMHTFGPFVALGMEVPFETEIEIPEPKPV